MFHLPHLRLHTRSTVTLHCFSSQPQASTITLIPSVPLIPCLSVTMQYLSFWDWLISLCIMSSSFIHIIMHITMSFLFFLKLICLFSFGCGGFLSLCVGFSLHWLLLLRSTDSRREGFHSCGTGA